MTRKIAKTSQRTAGPPEGGTLSRADRDNATFYVPVLGHWEPVPVRGNRDRRVAAVAAEQRGRANRRQLLAAAITPSQIETMLGAGWLRATFPGVYVVGHSPVGELTRETEALLACPLGALLSGLSAAALWRLVPWEFASDLVDITVGGSHQCRRPGIRLHRSITLDAKLDVRIRRGLPAVSAARALVEIAGVVSPRELERGLDDGLHSNVLRLAQVRETLTRIGSRRAGSPILDALLIDRERGSGISRSDGELALWDAIVASGLPRPERNQPLHGYIVDMFWRELRVVVEVDSYSQHLRKASFDSDRARDADLEARGFTVLRFTAKQIADEPLAVIAQLAAVLTWASARAV